MRENLHVFVTFEKCFFYFVFVCVGAPFRLSHLRPIEFETLSQVLFCVYLEASKDRFVDSPNWFFFFFFLLLDYFYSRKFSRFAMSKFRIRVFFIKYLIRLQLLPITKGSIKVFALFCKIKLNSQFLQFLNLNFFSLPLIIRTHYSAIYGEKEKRFSWWYHAPY